MPLSRTDVLKKLFSRDELYGIAVRLNAAPLKELSGLDEGPLAIKVEAAEKRTGRKAEDVSEEEPDDSGTEPIKGEVIDVPAHRVVDEGARLDRPKPPAPVAEAKPRKKGWREGRADQKSRDNS